MSNDKKEDQSLVSETQPDWSVDEEKALLRKLDFKLIPWIAVLYLAAYLDRVNIGNAKVANAELARIMVTWGICATCLAAVNSFPGLLVARFFLGSLEAGSFPGFIYYFSFWYKQHEQAKRIALFFSMASVAGAFSGLLASAISFLNGVGGLQGWRWIFLLEGIPTIFIGVGVWFFLPNFPQTETKWLSDRERHIAVNRLPPTAPSHTHKNFEMSELRKTLLSPGTWLFNLAFLCCLCPLYSVSYFNPTIIKNLGYTSYIAQLMTVPPYAASFVWTISLSYNRFGSNAFNLHWPSGFDIDILSLAFSVTAHLALDVSANAGAKFAGVFFATMGAFGTIPLMMAFRTKTMRGSATSAAVATAAMVSTGTIGSLVSPFLFPNWAGPRYVYGNIINIVLMTLGVFVLFTLRYIYRGVEEGIQVEPEESAPAGKA
ncbi:hypothetical protein HDU93_000048 [Gonapodya sp. JEL0774]|nr:hypothetical protein HDU93_000048 [Gonapodya sp. JEL0774]